MSTPPHLSLPADAVIEHWPARLGTRAVLHAGLGQRDSWAVFVPGFTGSKEDFIALPPLLADLGMGLLTYDQLGQHESAGSDDPADYELARIAEDLADLVEQAAERMGRTDTPHLVGHSFGGLVAQQAVAMGVVRPASLVLLCTGPGALPAHRWGPLPDLVEALPHTSLETLWSIKRELDAANAEAAGQPMDVDPEVDAFLEARWMRNHPQQLRAYATHLMRQESMAELLMARIAGPDGSPGIPLAIVWGEHDDAWPIPMQVELADRLGAVALEIPGAGHSPNSDDPQGLVAALARAWSASPGTMT
ncbi:MAG: alpha/beta fold hydrolase [Actinomycetales bacterium]